MIAHISFSERYKNKCETFLKLSSQKLYLLDPLFEFSVFNYIPRSFTIISNNGSSNFNIDMLNDTSPVIAKYIKSNPGNLTFKLDIDDKKNILEKFEQMYQGKLVIFYEDELPIAKQITNLLDISCCPSFLLQNDPFNHKSNPENRVSINRYCFSEFLKSEELKTFTIKTTKNEYKCNLFGIFASEVIKDYHNKNPTKTEYIYKFDDEFGEFQLICDIFNFHEVTITVQNMETLKEIADNLQIETIKPKIENFIKKYDKIYYKIDKQQNSIELINELFELLFHIKERTVEYVKTSIVQSFWSETEENVHELAAFILQVVNTDINYHKNMADLIDQLNKEANEKNKLNSLLPFIVKKLMYLFGETTFNCSFIYNLYKKNLIQKKDIINQIKSFFIKVKMGIFSPLTLKSNDDLSVYNDDNDENSSKFSFAENCVVFVILWFLPEVIEINKFNESLLEDCDNELVSFIKSFLPDKIDEYKKMRDNGEPDDLITKALRNDDIDTLQSIISSIENTKLIVPFNIFENFVPNGKTNYLNYSAAYGSIKCFKYLLLNFQKCDESTFSFAVYGGNTEIIKIVDNQKENNQEFENIEEDEETNTQNDYLFDIKRNANVSNYHFFMNYNFDDRNSDIYKIIPSITKHQNDLFDWIFEQKFSMNSKDKDLFDLLVINSAQNGNAHSLIFMINYGFKFSKKLINKVFQISSKKGFYRLSKIIYKTLNKANHHRYRYYFNPIACVSFGNLSIFRFYLNFKKTQSQLEKAFVYSVSLNHRNIIEYYFKKLVPNGFKFRSDCINEAMDVSVLSESSELFFYLIDQFNKINDSKIDFSEIDQKVLTNACAFNNIEAVKTILDSFISSVKNEQGSDFDSSELDLTEQFQIAAVSGSIEICKYLLNKKVYIDFNQLSTLTDELSSVNEEIFALMIKNSNYVVKQQFLHYFIEPAIENKNYGLVEFLLKENAPCENALFLAVQNDNLKMINLILKYKKEPSFINKSSGNGTALCVAVNRGDVKIVKALLSSPSINPNLPDENNNTPLMLAFPKVELMNPILDFYGENFIFQTEQIHFLLKKILHLLIAREPEAIPVLERFLAIKNINVNELVNEDNFLFYACKNNNTTVLKMLLNLETIDLNIYLPETGDTPLIVSIEKNSLDVAEILINDRRTNINAKNFGNKTAISIAFFKKQDKIIDILLKNEKFDAKDGCLDEIFRKVDTEYQKKILSVKSFDINHLLFAPKKSLKTSLFFNDSSEEYEDENDYKLAETILNYAVRTDNIEILGFVIKNPSFDKEKSDFKSAIDKSIKDGKLDIFRKLLNLIKNELNEYEINQKTIIYRAINYDQIEIVKEILNHPNFNYKKNKIFDDFCTNLISLKQNTYEIMKLLYLYDQKHDHLIDLNKISSFGETVFTSINWNATEISFFNIEKIVEFLIKNGSDPNIPNKKGKYPLQHAIGLKSYEFVCSLIKSNKIDFSKRIESIHNETFLHLAAILKEPSILKEFLDRNLIDINSTDDLGETPLMHACRFNRKENIKLLFEKDNLDFLHCNNEGNDALQIAQFFAGKKEIKTTKNKDEYCQLLLSITTDTAFTPISIDNSMKQNLYPYLSPSEKIEFYKDFNEISKVTYSNDKEKEAILHFVDNSSSFSESEDKDDNEELSSYYSESTDKPVKIYSSSNNSSVKDFSDLEGISSLERNSQEIPSQEHLSESTSQLEFTDSENKKELTKLPSLHKDSPKSPRKQKVENNAIKQRDEILQHPLNKSNVIKEKSSFFDDSSQKQSVTSIKTQLPDSIINSSPRVMMNKIRNLQIKSEKGNADAQYMLGIFYSTGKGVPVDKEKSFEYYLMAANQGHMNAQYSAACCFSYGKGTDVNKEKAFEFYLKAAEQGFDKAQFAVGHFYEFGQGVEKNHEKAVEWYQKAANQGHKGSIEALNYK